MSQRSGHPTSSILEEIRQSKPRTPSQETYIALVRTADDAKRFASRALEPAGVTLQQYNVLRILRGAGEDGLPTLAIAERMVERTPGVTRLIDRMERKGWVARQRCTEDRRRVWCRITSEGLDLLSSLDQPFDAVDNTMTEALDEAELAELLCLLERVRGHFNQPE